ncbi:MAG: SIS domain-containing protein [Bdellovibrionia bacterium]
MDYKSYIFQTFTEAANNIQRLQQNQGLVESLAEVANLIVESYKNGGRLYIAGNGGSAADAQHIAAELVAKLSKDRTSIPAFALTVDTSLLTAVGNDYGYDFIFSRQVQGLVKPQDVFLAITTSGNSSNIIKALEEAKKIGAKSVLLTGKDGGKAKAMNLADHFIIANGDNTAQIQEAHIVIYHCLCFMIEKALVESGHVKYF